MNTNIDGTVLNSVYIVEKEKTHSLKENLFTLAKIWKIRNINKMYVFALFLHTICTTMVYVIVLYLQFKD